MDGFRDDSVACATPTTMEQCDNVRLWIKQVQRSAIGYGYGESESWVVGYDAVDIWWRRRHDNACATVIWDNNTYVASVGFVGHDDASNGYVE